MAEIDAATLAGLLDSGALAAGLELVDVRGPDETVAGILPDARLIPAAGIVAALAAEPPRRVVVYCARGQRSAWAVARLRAAGVDAASLAGGFQAWQAAGLPVATPAAAATVGFSATELQRYSRQLRLPEIGLAGQARLRQARVLCIGAGGLGSPAALYLAAAGVGTLGIIDGDVVELSNLHRQVLHTTARVGEGKSVSAAQTLQALNPEITVVATVARLGPDNAAALLSGYDMVLDASDNFATRYLVNDVALQLGQPVIHAAIQGFEGQITVFPAGGKPCYRCLFPAPPPPEAAPSCDELGVLGVLPGVLGLLQATEALKLVLGIGTSLAGRLLLFDALATRFEELSIAADPDCPCGVH